MARPIESREGKKVMCKLNKEGAAALAYIMETDAKGMIQNYWLDDFINKQLIRRSKHLKTTKSRATPKKDVVPLKPAVYDWGALESNELITMILPDHPYLREEMAAIYNNSLDRYIKRHRLNWKIRTEINEDKNQMTIYRD